MGITASFVMPLYCDRSDAYAHATGAVQSIIAQSDPDWELVIVDDHSPLPDRRRRLDELQSMSPERIVVIALNANHGPGVCRNMGVDWAYMKESSIVLFHDADDLAHPRRLEVTKHVIGNGEADFVYSTFGVIDERGHRFPEAELVPSLREILEAHTHNPPQGRDCWIPIATQTGHLTQTSTVSVTTELARRHPFPDSWGSEDGHTFLRMSADGAVFSYQPDIPAQYRIHRTTGSAHRMRAGKDDYYRTKMYMDRDGFEKACALAVTRGVVTSSDVDQLRIQFLRRLAQTIDREWLQ